MHHLRDEKPGLPDLEELRSKRTDVLKASSRRDEAEACGASGAAALPSDPSGEAAWLELLGELYEWKGC